MLRFFIAGYRLIARFRVILQNLEDGTVFGLIPFPAALLFSSWLYSRIFTRFRKVLCRVINNRINRRIIMIVVGFAVSGFWIL